MALVIKKRVDLDFLGEDFKDTFVTFKSIPAKDLPEIVKLTKEAEESVDAIPHILKLLKKYFLDGEHEGEAVKAEDLDELDAETLVKCFEIITGQSADPKADGQSTNTSSTDTEPQPK